ncbi:MAG: glycosyltransferase [Oculatellaceae cyanobacterium Prado106]|nr:glycosyltransferase [Oculatellaceae cyanobacterium Prado106]
MVNLVEVEQTVSTTNPLVSIIINNFNYATFLTAAIDSALQQTYPHLEVIVVDDGSTDRSPEIIASYGQRVIPLIKTNGGQASCFNAGFAIAQGEIIFFLDSDDRLLPDIVAEVVSTFQSQDEAVKVQYYLQVVDAKDQPQPEFHPPLDYSFPEDLPTHILNFYNYTWPPTSGNAFRAAALRSVLPMPIAAHQIAADAYLNLVIALHGAVIPLRRVGGWYRVHGQNGFYAKKQELNLPHIHQLLRITADIQTKQRELFRQKYHLPVHKIGRWDIGTLKHKLILLKLDPSPGAISESRLNLGFQGCVATLCSDIGWRSQLIHLVWFSTTPFLPQILARFLTQWLLYPDYRRQRMNQLFIPFRFWAKPQARS